MYRTLVILAFFATVALGLAAPDRLSSFNTTMEALRTGRQVRIVMEYAKMMLSVDGEESKGPEAIGGLSVGEWEYFAKGVFRNEKAYVATSQSVLIASSRYGHVYNYVRVRIFEDDTVEVMARYLKTDNFEIVMDETFKGKISKGKDDNGVSIFADR